MWLWGSQGATMALEMFFLSIKWCRAYWQHSSGLPTSRGFPVEALTSGSKVWETRLSFWMPCGFLLFWCPV